MPILLNPGYQPRSASRNPLQPKGLENLLPHLGYGLAASGAGFHFGTSPPGSDDGGTGGNPPPENRPQPHRAKSKFSIVNVDSGQKRLRPPLRTTSLLLLLMAEKLKYGVVGQFETLSLSNGIHGVTRENRASPVNAHSNVILPQRATGLQPPLFQTG